MQGLSPAVQPISLDHQSHEAAADMAGADSRDSALHISPMRVTRSMASPDAGVAASGSLKALTQAEPVDVTQPNSTQRMTRSMLSLDAGDKSAAISPGRRPQAEFASSPRSHSAHRLTRSAAGQGHDETRASSPGKSARAQPARSPEPQSTQRVTRSSASQGCCQSASGSAGRTQQAQPSSSPQQHSMHRLTRSMASHDDGQDAGRRPQAGPATSPRPHSTHRQIRSMASHADDQDAGRSPQAEPAGLSQPHSSHRLTRSTAAGARSRQQSPVAIEPSDSTEAESSEAESSGTEASESAEDDESDCPTRPGADKSSTAGKGSAARKATKAVRFSTEACDHPANHSVSDVDISPSTVGASGDQANTVSFNG